MLRPGRSQGTALSAQPTAELYGSTEKKIIKTAARQLKNMREPTRRPEISKSCLGGGGGDKEEGTRPNRNFTAAEGDHFLIRVRKKSVKMLKLKASKRRGS